MKIRHLVIENFKAIKRFEHSFVDELTGQIRPVTALFGDNGSGKTSVLQAIALVVSLATMQIESVSQFQWLGFLADRLASRGSEPYIKIELFLEQDEIDAVHEAFTLWDKIENTVSHQTKHAPPAHASVITIEYKEGKLFVQGGEQNAKELLGRWYGIELLKKSGQYFPLINRLGSVFWFDQYRNLGSGRAQVEQLFEDNVGWQAGVSKLREYLIPLWTLHQQSNDQIEVDYIVLMEQKFSQIFSGAKFAGVELKKSASRTPKISDWYFLIERGDTRYDISEMSSGEQAVFAVMFDFVMREISRSIVLIDELELHLHPPEQQALYNSLRKIGPDCQFIITSHSPYLRDIIPDKNKVRLEGGRLCL